MTGKVFHLVNKTVLDLTHDEVKYFIDITVAQAISGEDKDNKKNKYGPIKKQRKQEKKTKRDRGLPLAKRFKELNSKKRTCSLICSRASTSAR